MGESVTMEATVEQITFRNESNGWTVMQLKKGQQRITAVGAVLSVNKGEKVRVSGEWNEHPDYGRQLRLSGCEIVRQTNAADIERYLASGVIRGVGPATAHIIVQEFGRDALDILENAPEKLCELAGIGPKRAGLIAESYRSQMATRQTMMFLQKSGFSAAMAAKVMAVYKGRTEEIVRGNPYQLVKDISGIGFGTADRIAMQTGIPRESPFRIQCGIIHTLQDAAGTCGHVYLPAPELISTARRLLSVPEELIQNGIAELRLHHDIVIEDSEDACEIVYLENMYNAECEIAYRLTRLLNSYHHAPPADIGRRIARFEGKQSIKFSAEQKQAVRLALSSGAAVITGGPGTGKTTIIRCILSLLPADAEIALCAPTGRAARRMADATGAEASTIHRLLKYDAENAQGFAHDSSNPLDADVVICDEMSMVDISLMRSLLRAVKDDTRLILVGDADQLPSVGPGSVLKDILQSGQVPSVRLTEIHRQSESSMIVFNAHRINAGEMPVLNKKGGDFFIERQETPAQTAMTIVDLVCRRLPSFAHVDALTGIQVLAPARKGENGVYALNSMLQDALNPDGPDAEEYKNGDMLLRTGDKVIHTKNDYALKWTCGGEAGSGVFNGEIGLITSINNAERSVTVRFEDERTAVYDASNVEELELAYCISVHKSQGCEFPVVVMPAMPGPRMLMARNLLYTAVTRARNCVVLVGREGVVADMIANNYISRRYTALSRRICEYMRAASKEAPDSPPEAAPNVSPSDIDSGC